MLLSSSAPSSMASDTERASGGGAAASGTAADGGAKSGSLSAASFSWSPRSSLATSSVRSASAGIPRSSRATPSARTLRRGYSGAQLRSQIAARQAVLEQRIPALLCHALEAKRRSRLLEQRGDPLQAAAVERHRHGSVANFFREILQRDALIGGGVAQLEELVVGGPELGRHPESDKAALAVTAKFTEGHL
eukprot:scaffold28821_cov63-Phaeocystis_antarctica.AAC.4